MEQVINWFTFYHFQLQNLKSLWSILANRQNRFVQLNLPNNHTQIFSNKHGLTKDQIELLTGRTPREMKHLDNADSVSDFMRTRRDEFYRNITTVFNSLTTVAQQNFLENLDCFFGLKISSTSTIDIDEQAMDAGLLYYDKPSKQYKTVSHIASQALMRFFLDNANLKLIPILSHVSK